MSRQKRAGTISVVLIGLLVLGACLTSMGTHVSAIARLQSATVTPTCDASPGDCADQATDDAIDAMTATADAMTATADAMTEVADAMTAEADAVTPGAQTATSTMTPGVGTPTATPTPTRASTSIPLAAPLAPTLIPPTPTIEIDPQRLAPTETPTALPDSALICFPGQPLVITGGGPARAAFLLYFGQRVVSGGSVTPNGRFATTLVVGRERAGVYPITVRVRGSTKVLLATSCAVPNVAPTLVPRARELP